MVPLQVIILAVFVGDAICDFELTVLHTNDVHARVLEIDQYSGLCSQEESDKKECFGGYSRIMTKVGELRSKYPNTLLVDAGGQIQGSQWLFKYWGMIVAFFMDLIGYNAMGLGNHEFDHGPKGLHQFVNDAKFPVLSCNTDMSKYPELAAVRKSTIIDVNGEKVGIIGYTTTETPFISQPENITFLPVLESIQAEADKLTSQGVNKIIAVGHAGYIKDKELASKLRGVDVIVGGQTGTFLYTGTPPSKEVAVGEYPTVVTNSDGHKVLIVQDTAFGKYLGNLQVTFDDAGIVKAWGGNPVLLDHTVPQDEKALKVINGCQLFIQMLNSKNVVGTSSVKLVGDKSVCRRFECNMGNLITDAMVQENHRESDGMEWSDVTVAMINGGSIRADIAKGDVTVTDVMSVQPFGNTVDIIEITGQTLLDILEHCAGQWTDSADGWGGFLQMSGLRIVYDISKDKGARVVKVDIACADCPMPEFKPLDKEKVYKVIMQNELINGMDGYTMIKENIIKQHTIGFLLSDILLNYVKHNTPMSKGLEGRIRFVNGFDSV